MASNKKICQAQFWDLAKLDMNITNTINTRKKKTLLKFNLKWSKKNIMDL